MSQTGKQAPKAGKSADVVIPVAGNEEEVVKGSASDIQVKREIYEKNKEIEEKDEELVKLRKQLEEARRSVVPVSPGPSELDQLKAQVEHLSRQIITGARGDKVLFRSPTASDLQEDSVTFTARSVYYVVASYMDSNGIEKIPPHKLIIFTYQASDIRKDGKEEVIKNFSQFTTNLKTEIGFLRKHPHYGITFSENTNEMMEEDTRDTQFKVRAANHIMALSPEAIYARADEYKIPNWRQKSADELKPMIVEKMAEEYKAESKKLNDDIIRRRILASTLMTEGKTDE